MSDKFQEYKGLDLAGVTERVLAKWKEEKTFAKSIESRKGKPSFVFYEGPPSANGMPGIHHVMARTIKDIFCRYKTMDGYQVNRKAGWDTHGLPVELSVEKSLGITKEDIGKKISVEEYNATCRKEVMKYTDKWEELTDKVGYWVDMDDPYVTYDNRYIETLWYLLKNLFDQGYLYKGKTIQPYSPAAGTGLSTHELNQPGCYRDVKDTTITAQFKVEKNNESAFLFEDTDTDVYLLAWTTTPWTLPSNTALAVGAGIEYVKVRTFNQYTGAPITVVLAKDQLYTYFNKKHEELALEDYNEGDKKVPFKVLDTYKGDKLAGVRFEQLVPWVRPDGDAFRVITGDYVTTEEGTGIVHIAPTFGADDDRVAKQAGIAPLILIDKNGYEEPMVDKKGRFYPLDVLDEDFVKKFVNDEYKEYAGRYVKNDYDESAGEDTPLLDVDLSVMLKKDNKAFKIEKYVHNYPHCWRTDKPILYYPLDSWFIKTTAFKERMLELNNTINWKPQSTGEGRFGKWLENLVDWNLSRSRYWGTPLPIWSTEDRSQMKCIGSVKELMQEIDKSIEAGAMKSHPFPEFKVGEYNKQNYELIDLHKPYVDDIVLVADDGKPMRREPDLIDVWFDSGAMPFAQWHYPFENKDGFDSVYPADFIAEGVDQTRGWFFTLHAISTMTKDSVAFKNIISNGLVLDKNGNKMSKRLGNAVDPFKAMDKYGTDPLRWYMITNAQPWDNLKFDISGVEETSRKFFGTLYNTYSFFSLYANIDGFAFKEDEVLVDQRPEIDRWVLSLLNSLKRDVMAYYEAYEPTRAGRAIEEFVLEYLSNWYVRLNRKRFWGGEYNEDKVAAYQTLYTCLETVARLAAPIAPFFMDQLFRDLNAVSGKDMSESVHLAYLPEVEEARIDKDLEERMDLAQRISSMVLSLRRKVNIKVRQPLQKIMVPVFDMDTRRRIQAVEDIIKTEVNLKTIEFLEDTTGVLVKKIKPNFKTLGPKYGKQMKAIAAAINQMDQDAIAQFEKDGSYSINANGETINLDLGDVEIVSEDIPGWLVANDDKLTIALDITITDELKQEGLAREFINRIQNMRKDEGLDVTDKINLYIGKHESINNAVKTFTKYIAQQTLANEITLTDKMPSGNAKEVEVDTDVKTTILIEKV
ncbi:Isoleucine--tRNA ligase [Salinivirga cyanobacteriivorans]|uniref:Isoleucine--tRNA ligase n=1 Tax=Salinivirga cyanobacteriivorans TaxID=1307839 RepID=A0A0S2HZD3_9BACT|nr:isoleucine--tRNA ligase [Salinivirga cyanobacteriivorans]ALO15371.1 Isoleucine--tRNA ligase [Salinivirga cyanobacteriivorans]